MLLDTHIEIFSAFKSRLLEFLYDELIAWIKGSKGKKKKDANVSHLETEEKEPWRGHLAF